MLSKDWFLGEHLQETTTDFPMKTHPFFRVATAPWLSAPNDIIKSQRFHLWRWSRLMYGDGPESLYVSQSTRPVVWMYQNILKKICVFMEGVCFIGFKRVLFIDVHTLQMSPKWCNVLFARDHSRPLLLMVQRCFPVVLLFTNSLNMRFCRRLPFTTIDVSATFGGFREGIEYNGWLKRKHGI